MKQARHAPGGRPGLVASTRRTRPGSRFETGDAAFMVNYPFVYPSAKDERARDLQEHGVGALPAVDRGQARPAALGGINLGVGALLEAPGQAFDAAAACAAANQKIAANKGGLPPTPTRSTTTRRSTRRTRSRT